MSKWKFGNVVRWRGGWNGDTSDIKENYKKERDEVADIAEELAEMLEGIVEGKGIRTYGDARALLDRFRVQEEQTVEAKLAVLSKQCAWDDINANMVYLAQAIDALRAEVRGK